MVLYAVSQSQKMNSALLMALFFSFDAGSIMLSDWACVLADNWMVAFGSTATVLSDLTEHDADLYLGNVLAMG